jgi:hypothetical protein
VIRPAAVVVTAVLALAGAGAAPAAAAVRLSGPDHTWYWAFVDRSAPARAKPSAHARVLTRLARRTPEATANLVLALARQGAWVRVRLPILPDGSTGWVRRSRLGGWNTVRTHLFVDRARERLRLERAGHTVFRARVGVGRPAAPTPRGEFYVRERIAGFHSSFYGPLAFGTSARSAVLTDWPGGGFIGIHGTNAPGLIPGRPSHGCIRLRNPDILRLGRLMGVGTPVTVS